MRATWKGSISFGLVSIPISVYPATREEKVAFKQLRKKDQSPIRYKKIAEAAHANLVQQRAGSAKLKIHFDIKFAVVLIRNRGDGVF